MDDLEEVPVGYEEMDDESLNIKFRKLCHDIVMKVCKSFGLYIYTYMVLKITTVHHLYAYAIVTGITSDRHRMTYIMMIANAIVPDH